MLETSAQFIDHEIPQEDERLAHALKTGPVVMVLSGARMDYEGSVASELTPRSGLELEITDHNDRQAVHGELMHLREIFSSGNSESVFKAIDALSDATFLALGDKDIVAITGLCETEEQKELCSHALLQRLAEITSQSVRSSDYFAHQVFGGGKADIVKSGLLKPKSRLLKDGTYNSVTGSARGEVTEEMLDRAVNTEFDDESGLHSLMMHASQVESAKIDGYGFTIFMPPKKVVERTPFVMLGQDQQGVQLESAIKLIGDEAHDGGMRYRYGAVKVRINEELRAQLPVITHREMARDVTFMRSVDNVQEAGDYAFNIEDGILSVPETALPELARSLDPESAGIPRDLFDKYFTEDSLMQKRLLSTQLGQILDMLDAGKAFDDIPFASPEGKKLFERLLSHCSEAKDFITKAIGEGILSEQSVKTYAIKTALIRMIVTMLGRSEEWVRSSVFVGLRDFDGEINDALSIHIQATEREDSSELIVNTGSQELAFTQKDLAQDAVANYKKAKI